MRFQATLAICGFSLFSCSAAAPSTLLQRATTSTSCASEALTPDTWISLEIDTFLAAWSAANVTVTATDNVQSLAASFDAPNFFWWASFLR